MSTNRRRRSLLAVILLALAAAAVAAALLVRPNGSVESSTSAVATSPGSGQAVGNPATTEAYTLKPEPTFVATDEPQPPTGGRVDVVLSYVGFEAAAGTVQANGFAAAVLEDGGTCTLTLTRDSVVVTATGTGTADATTTSCGLLETAPGLASGTWKARLSYSSDGSSGESGQVDVTVP